MKNPVSDLMYDWITILQSKAEGINAYEKYLKDAQSENSKECIDLLNRLRDQDIRMTEEIYRHVAGMLGEETMSQSGVQQPRSQVRADQAQQGSVTH